MFSKLCSSCSYTGIFLSKIGADLHSMSTVSAVVICTRLFIITYIAYVGRNEPNLLNLLQNATGIDLLVQNKYSAYSIYD